MTRYSRRGFMLGMVYAIFVGLPLHINESAYYYAFSIPLLVVAAVSVSIVLVKEEVMS